MSEVQPEGLQQPAETQETAEPEVEYAQIPAEQWQQMQQMVEQLGPLAEYVNQLPQQQEPYQQQQPGFEFDWDNPVESMRQLIRDEVAPIASFTQEQQYAEANEQAADILSDYLKSQGAQFLGDEKQQEYAREQALIRANHYVIEEAQRFGEGLEAAEAAIKRAVDEQLAHDQAVGQAYAEQNMQQVRQITQAPQQPNLTSAQAAQTLTTPTGGPQAVFQKYFGGS